MLLSFDTLQASATDLMALRLTEMSLGRVYSISVTIEA